MKGWPSVRTGLVFFEQSKLSKKAGSSVPMYRAILFWKSARKCLTRKVLHLPRRGFMTVSKERVLRAWADQVISRLFLLLATPLSEPAVDVREMVMGLPVGTFPLTG